MFGLLAGVAFVACTNDDDPAGVTPVNGGNEVAANKSYMMVNFVMPGNATTRADGGFAIGDENENTISKGVLFFFDDNLTQQVADPFVLGANGSEALEGTTLNWTLQESGNIENKSTAIIVIANPLTEPTHVLAVLNADLATLKLDKSSTLAEIKARVDDYAAAAYTTKGTFVMSNSVYQEDVTAEITKTYKTVEEAKADAAKNPAVASVDIYVERVAAKVAVDIDGATWNLANADTENGETASNKVKIVNAQGVVEEVELEGVIEGWWLDNAVDKSFLLKKFPTSKDVDAANFRSYWAGAIPAGATFKHFAFEDAAANKGKAIYTNENVNAENPTQAVVAVTLKKKGGDALNLVRYLENVYTVESFNTALANKFAHKYFKAKDNGYETVDATDFVITYVLSKKEGETVKYYYIAADGAKTDIVAPEGYTFPTDLKDYQAYTMIQAKETTEFLERTTKADGTYEYGPADAEALKAELAAGGYTVDKWSDGMAYYFVPIKHDLGTKYTVGNGVIRNHVYQITVTSINGLGTPVPFKENDEIIPIKPEPEGLYISAKINVLAWKVVTQNVNLGK